MNDRGFKFLNLSQTFYMRFCFTYALIIVVGTLGACLSCGDPISSLEKEIGSYWHDHCSANDVCLVRIQELTDVRWDRMYVFQPYTSEQSVRAALGSEEFVDLEFTRKIVLMNGNSIAYIEQTPSNMENYVNGEAVFLWENGERFGFYLKEEATFIVQKTPLDNNRGHYFTLRQYQ
jgi:hypothetical protein